MASFVGDPFSREDGVERVTVLISGQRVCAARISTYRASAQLNDRDLLGLAGG